MRTRSMRAPILTRGIIRSVWLLKAAPSPGAGAADQVPTQCMLSLMAFDASLSGSRTSTGKRPPSAMRPASCPDSFRFEPDLLVGRRPGIRVDQEQRRLGHAGADAAGPDEFVEGTEADTVVDELLDLVEHGFALAAVALPRLLSRERIDAGGRAARVRASALHRLSQPGGRVAEVGQRAHADALDLLAGPGRVEGGALHRAHLHPDAHRPQVADERLPGRPVRR